MTHRIHSAGEASDLPGSNPVVYLDLTKLNGNAFSLMSAWKKQAKRAGWSFEDIERVLHECMTGDYDHLVQTLIKNC